GTAGVGAASRAGPRPLGAPAAQPTRRSRHGVPAGPHAAPEESLSVRRPLHFVPGGQEKMIAKALPLPADGLILDLEDAVPPPLKPAPRPLRRRWLDTPDFRGPGPPVRVDP